MVAPAVQAAADALGGAADRLLGRAVEQRGDVAELGGGGRGPADQTPVREGAGRVARPQVDVDGAGDAAQPHGGLRVPADRAVVQVDRHERAADAVGAAVTRGGRDVVGADLAGAADGPGALAGDADVVAVLQERRALGHGDPDGVGVRQGAAVDGDGRQPGRDEDEPEQRGAEHGVAATVVLRVRGTTAEAGHHGAPNALVMQPGSIGTPNASHEKTAAPRQ